MMRVAFVRFVGGAFAAVLLASTAANAAPLERDLGEGLGYVRIHSIPEDLPTKDWKAPHACVVDLRYARGDKEATRILAAWLELHATAAAPILALVNGATEGPVAAALANRDHTPGLLVIGVPNSKCEPDIAVTESPHDERRAYEILENGGTVSSLTTDNPDKQRNDEASLARDRAPEAESDADTDVVPDQTITPKVRRTPIDAALQQAIHVYRGLRAMKAL